MFLFIALGLACHHSLAHPTQTEAGYTPHETGVRRRANGTLHVRALTPMPGVEPAMVAWWFEDYLQTTEHYKRWYPEAHVWMDWEDKRPGTVVGAKHLVHEYIGPDLHKLRIQFVAPPMALPADTWAACARVGPLDEALYTGGICHLVRPVQGGSEMRSYFTLGHIQRRDGETATPSLFGAIANTPLVRRAAVSKDVGVDLMAHCIAEMSILAGFLPDLYAEEHTED